MNQEHRLIHFRWVLALAKSGLVLVILLWAVGCRTQLPEVTYGEFYPGAIGAMAAGLTLTTVETCRVSGKTILGISRSGRLPMVIDYLNKDVTGRINDLCIKNTSLSQVDFLVNIG